MKLLLAGCLLYTLGVVELAAQESKLATPPSGVIGVEEEMLAPEYRSMGLILPPKANARGKSPAFHHQLFSAADSHEMRLKAVMEAEVGDLIVVPGHVLMILGKVHGQPYVIQDVPFAVFHEPAGKIHRTKLNEVSVTPLLPLLADESHSYVDLMTSLVHVTERE